MAGRIFINYRRDVNAAAAGRLFDRLTQHFDRDQLFMDVDAIEPGVDFVRTLDEQLAQCSAFIAVIGRDWVDLQNAAGKRRLEDPHDYVRVEIEAALRREIRCVPVLVDGARMPLAEELPDSLKPLTRRNAIEVAHHRFASDVDELARVLQRALGIAAKGGPPQSFVEGGNAKPDASWIDLLFSFKGRISRKQFWLSGLALTVFALIVAVALLAAFGPTAFAEMQLPTLFKITYHVATLSFYWPAFALSLKRLHDFGQGWPLFLPAAILTPLYIGLDIAGQDQAAHNVLLVALGVWTIIGCIKGTPGANEHGPDPLTRARKSAPATQNN